MLSLKVKRRKNQNHMKYREQQLWAWKTILKFRDHLDKKLVQRGKMATHEPNHSFEPVE